MRDAGGELADGGHAVFEPQLGLELFHLGEVLEDQRVAGRLAVERRERRRGEADAPLRAADSEILFAAHHGAARHQIARAVPFVDGKETEVGDVPAEHARHSGLQNLTCGRIHERRGAVARKRHQTGRDRFDDVLVERAQLREVLPISIKLLGRLLQLLGDVRREQRRCVEAGQVRGDVEVDARRGPSRHRQERLLRQRDDVEVHQVAQHAVQDRGARRRKQSAAPIEQHRRGDDRDQIQKRERRIEAAGKVNEQRLDQQIARDLHHQIDAPRSENLPDADVRERQRVRQSRREIDVVDRQQLTDGELNDERRQKQRRHDDDAHGDEHASVGLHRS